MSSNHPYGPTRKCRALTVERLERRTAPAVIAWTGGGADNLWSNPANWVGDVAPQPGDDLQFPSRTTAQTPVNDFPAGTAFGSINFTGSNYILNGNRITLAQGLSAGPLSGSDSIAFDVTLAAPQCFTSGGTGYTVTGALDLNGNTLTLTGAGGTALAGPITGAGSIIKEGTGTVVLSGTNAYTGPTHIRSGVVEARSGTALGAAGPGNDSTVEFGAALAFNGTFNVAEVITFVGGAISFPYDIFQAVGQSPLRSISGSTTLTGPLTLAGDASVGVAIRASMTITGALGNAPGTTGAVFLYGPIHFTPTATASVPCHVISGATLFDGQGGTFVLGPSVGGSLGGTGRVGSVVCSAGVINPADGNPGALSTGDVDIGNQGSDTSPAVLLIDLTGQSGQVTADRLDVQGGVTLRSPTLKVMPVPGFVPPAGTRVRIIDNDGNDAVHGIFAGLPEGAATVVAGDQTLRITYRGGDGNDVELFMEPTRVPLSAVGAGPGGGPLVNVYDISGSFVRSFFAYDSAFRGGVRVATGDVTGDGIDDVVTGAGPGGGPHVKVWDGATGSLIREFMAYDPAFGGGVFVAVGDVSGDSIADIVCGAGAGGGPHVKVFDGKAGALIDSFFAYDQAFGGGVTVAAGDTNADDVADIITGAGPGGGPHVKVFDGKSGAARLSFFAYDPAFRGGVFVASGDVRATGGADIITGAGAGGWPQVRVFDGLRGGSLLDFYAYDQRFGGGVTVSAADWNGDGLAEIVTGAGPGGGPHVRVLTADASGPRLTARQVSSFFAYDPVFAGGVFVS